MNRIYLFYSFIFIIGLLLISSGSNIYAKVIISTEEDAQLSSQDAVAIILLSKGDVSITSSNGMIRQAKTKDLLFVGDRLETRKNGFVQVNFKDGSSLRLSKNGDFTVDAYHFNEMKKEAKHEISVEQGTLSFIAGKISKIAPENYKIKTATAVIGIRGSAGEAIITKRSLMARVSKGHKLVIRTPDNIVL